tara:strand:+ start:225 stop:389 length:165 start_codon:yes stop_codon:yes gene_type:complete
VVVVVVALAAVVAAAATLQFFQPSRVLVRRGKPTENNGHVHDWPIYLLPWTQEI